MVQLLSFLAIFLFVMGLYKVIRGEPLPARPDAVEKPPLFQAFRNETEVVGATIENLANRAFPQEAENIQNDLIVASLADQLTPREIRGAQGLMGLTCFALGGVGVFIIKFNLGWAIISAVGLGLFGWMFPARMWLNRLARSRQDQISKALPYAIDLLTVAMQAGQDFGAAVRLLVNEGPKGPLRQEFGIMLRQTELGKSRVEALRDLDGRVQLPELKSCCSAVIQSTEMGSSVAATLKLQAEEIRRTRFHKAERKAARAPSIMLIPIALFILPAVFIVIFTPVFLRINSVLGSGE